MTLRAIVITLQLLLIGVPAPADESKPAAEEPPRELYSGRVVLVQEALKKRGIKVADEMKNQAVLETADGELIPIAADWRGRAFYQDKRLRDRDVELVAYRRPGIPYLQVLIIFVLDKNGDRQEMDYWCEICSIPMYEIKDCECCQGPIEFRLRPGRLPGYLTLSKKPSARGPSSDSPTRKSTSRDMPADPDSPQK